MTIRDPNWEYLYARHLYDDCQRRSVNSPVHPTEHDAARAAAFADAAHLARLRAQIDPWPTAMVADLEPGAWFLAEHSHWQSIEAVRIFDGMADDGRIKVRYHRRSYMAESYPDGDTMPALGKPATVYPPEIMALMKDWPRE